MALFWVLVTIVVVVLTPDTAVGNEPCVNGDAVTKWEYDDDIGGNVNVTECVCHTGWSGELCDQSTGVTAEEVLILLDVSESLKDSLSKVSGFIATFYSLTSTDTFFQTHKRKVTVATFNEGLVAGEQWVVDYSQYNTAADLRTAEAAEVNAIVTTIGAKEASGKTNIGQTLQEALTTYSLNQNWRVIMVSDFINIRKNPAIADVLQQYSDGGIKTVPVIVDKTIRHESTYNAVKAASVGGYGIDLSQGLDGGGINAIYNL